MKQNIKQKSDFRLPCPPRGASQSGVRNRHCRCRRKLYSYYYNNERKRKRKGKVALAFKVTQKESSMGILLDLQKFFGCGTISIDNRLNNAYKFSVYRLDDIINKVLPHFDKHPLLTSKYLDYQDFKKVALLMQKGVHLDDINAIEEQKQNMNTARSFEERWAHLKSCEPIQLNNDWVQGFIDGEGSFQFGMYSLKNRGKPSLALHCTLEIAQSSHDVIILDAIRKFFGCGYLKPKYDIHDLEAVKKSRSVSRLVIGQPQSVIELLDQYPLLTRKYLDYLDWKTLIQLKADRAQDTAEGLAKMHAIRDGMNSKRKP